jgi:hypothetical protein
MTTLDYGPGGWCGLCGTVDNYSCDKGIHSVHWNNGIRTFQDPTVCGATSVKVTVYGGDLGAVLLRVLLNDVLIGEQEWNGSPLCDTCTTVSFESDISSSDSSAYVIGGENRLQLVPVGDDNPELSPAICIERVELDFIVNEGRSCTPSTTPSDVPSIKPSLEPTLYPSDTPSTAPSTLVGRSLRITLVVTSMLVSVPPPLDPSLDELPSTESSSDFCLSAKRIDSNKDIELRPCCLSRSTQRKRNWSRGHDIHDQDCDDAKEQMKQIWFFDSSYQLRLFHHPEYCIQIQNGSSELKLDLCDGFSKKTKTKTKTKRSKSSSKGSSNSKSTILKTSTPVKFQVEDSSALFSRSNSSNRSSRTYILWLIDNENDLNSINTLNSMDPFPNKFVGLKQSKSLNNSKQSKSVKGDKSSKSTQRCEKSKIDKSPSSRFLKSSKSCKNNRSDSILKKQPKAYKLQVYEADGSTIDSIGKSIWMLEFLDTP